MISNTIGYKKLIAWQKADLLAHSVYDISLSFPKEEQFGLTSQLKRAILSVPLNIVEGYGRNGKKEFARFLLISLGSLAESGYILEFAYKREFINELDFEKVISLKEEVAQLCWKLYTSVRVE